MVTDPYGARKVRRCGSLAWQPVKWTARADLTSLARLSQRSTPATAWCAFWAAREAFVPKAISWFIRRQ